MQGRRIGSRAHAPSVVCASGKPAETSGSKPDPEPAKDESTGAEQGGACEDRERKRKRRAFARRFHFLPNRQEEQETVQQFGVPGGRSPAGLRSFGSPVMDRPSHRCVFLPFCNARAKTKTSCRSISCGAWALPAPGRCQWLRRHRPATPSTVNRRSPYQASTVSPVLSVSVAMATPEMRGAASPNARAKSSATLRACTTH